MSAITRDGSASALYMKFDKILPSAQGMAIWGDFAFQLFHTGQCAVFDLKSGDPEPLCTFPLGSFNEGTPADEYTNHANQCMFSNVHRDGNPVPLLYVTIGHGTGADEDGYYYRCAVEDLHLEYGPDGRVIGGRSECLQIISYKDGPLEGMPWIKPCWGCPAWFVDSVAVAATPDEEIGRGPDHVDIKKFGAKFAFTVDGSSPEEFSYETFNAAHAEVIIKGVSIHPGDAKGKLVNASTVAFAFDRALPEKQRPEFTCGREGFNHLVGVMGSVDEAKMHYIIRNHDKNLLESQKKDFEKAKAAVEKAFPGCKVELKIENDYRNMREVIDQHPEVLEAAFKGYKRVGIEPKIDPIRGGTDGAGFSFMGCPCPNLGTGSYNHHGRFEYLDVNEFHQMIDLVVAILSE